MFGERLAAARKKAGLAQVELAVEMGDRYDQTMISHVESGRSGLISDGLVRAAEALRVSTDWLLGITDDPTPASERNRTDTQTLGESRSDYRPGDATSAEDIELLMEVAGAAGIGAEVYDEATKERVPFLTSWLRRTGIRPADCHIISVHGDSMEPTLPDGCSVIVDRSRREPREGRIYVLRDEDGVVVKRLDKDEEGRWLALSDNPQWESNLLTCGVEIIGEVRWSAVTY